MIVVASIYDERSFIYDERSFIYDERSFIDSVTLYQQGLQRV